MKKAQTAWTFIYSLVLLFVVGVLIIIFMDVIDTQIRPITNTMISDNSNISSYFNDSQSNDLRAYHNQMETYFDSIPIIFFVAILIFIVIAAVRAKSDEARL